MTTPQRPQWSHYHVWVFAVDTVMSLIDAAPRHVTHRLYRAWREGVPQLPAYLLTVAESRLVQEDRRLGPGRTWRVGPR